MESLTDEHPTFLNGKAITPRSVKPINHGDRFVIAEREFEVLREDDQENITPSNAATPLKPQSKNLKTPSGKIPLKSSTPSRSSIINKTPLSVSKITKTSITKTPIAKVQTTPSKSFSKTPKLGFAAKNEEFLTPSRPSTKVR